MKEIITIQQYAARLFLNVCLYTAFKIFVFRRSTICGTKKKMKKLKKCFQYVAFASP